jgi:hypothetical protein
MILEIMGRGKHDLKISKNSNVPFFFQQSGQRSGRNARNSKKFISE